MLTQMFHFFRRMTAAEMPKPLGRWGYYWDSKMIHQRYYD